MNSLDERAAAARDACTVRHFGRRASMADELADLARLEAAGSSTWDLYGDGGPVAEVEARIADLLGKPAAAFFPSGIMAQQVALRAWCDRAGSRRVAMPNLSHLLVHELDGPRIMQQLDIVHLTEGARVALASDVAALPADVGAVLVELPLRDGGYLAPTWDELRGVAEACRARGVPLHLDGARLWECQPYYGRPHAEIAALADTVYVSFYKGLGGLAGACLAGPVEVIDEARTWRRRMGGTVFTMFPFALAALRGLDELLPRMGEFHARAHELAVALRAAGATVTPDNVRSVAFRLFAQGAPDELRERAVELMERTGVLVPDRWAASETPGWSFAEVTVSAATMTASVNEVVGPLMAVVGLHVD